MTTHPAPAADVTQQATELYAALVACETPDEVAQLAHSQIYTRPVAGIDISMLISDTAREEFRIRDRQPYPLAAFAHLLCIHGMGIP